MRGDGFYAITFGGSAQTAYFHYPGELKVQWENYREVGTQTTSPGQLQGNDMLSMAIASQLVQQLRPPDALPPQIWASKGPPPYIVIIHDEAFDEYIINRRNGW